MNFYQDGHPEPMAFQYVGSSTWSPRWLQIYTETNDIFVYNSQKMNVTTLCGKLDGESPMAKLQFDRNGLLRSYFKVFDPETGRCVGNARCLKETAVKIMKVLLDQGTTG